MILLMIYYRNMSFRILFQLLQKKSYTLQLQTFLTLSPLYIHAPHDNLYYVHQIFLKKTVEHPFQNKNNEPIHPINLKLLLPLQEVVVLLLQNDKA